MKNKYCFKLCENHPKTHDLYGKVHTCIGDNGAEYALKEEHSKGRPILKRKGCPLGDR